MAGRPTSRPSDSVYNPPTLPTYLKNVCALEQIVGVPSDEEVKGIHAVLRAAHGAAQIPGMHDPELSKDLAEHLFDIQMARYCSRYSFGIYISDIVYTPPALPPQISIALGPVVGLPSDEELKAVQAAVRASENLALIPGMFDADLNMSLSQHMFDIQIARYLERSMRRRFSSGGTQSNASDLPPTAMQPRTPGDVGEPRIPASAVVASGNGVKIPPSVRAVTGLDNGHSLGRPVGAPSTLSTDGSGSEDKIVVGINIGTNQAGVAFAYMLKGTSPTIHQVSSWPGREAQTSQSKIPALVWYDRNKAVSHGAEALSPVILEQAEDECWSLAKHFNLHLYPSDMKSNHGPLDDLPSGVALQQIYADFLTYLLKHLKEYFEARIIDGKRMWERYSPTMEVAFVHPNGWGIREQTLLRAAITSAGFTSSQGASSRIRFVTKGEASVHISLYHSNFATQLQPGTVFAVCDVGTHNVQTTVYSVTSTNPVLKLEEKRASTFVSSGASLIDQLVERHLHSLFTNAGFDADDVKEYCQAGVRSFENGEKWAFRDEEQDSYIEVGASRLNDSSLRMRRGRMALSSSTMKSFFDPCFDQIIESVDQQLEGMQVSCILLIGKLWDSLYIRDKFQKRYKSQGYIVILPNNSMNVEQGAVLWHSPSVFALPKTRLGAEFEK